jgi:hypothetical protein
MIVFITLNVLSRIKKGSERNYPSDPYSILSFLVYPAVITAKINVSDIKPNQNTAYAIFKPKTLLDYTKSSTVDHQATY